MNRSGGGLQPRSGPTDSPLVRPAPGRLSRRHRRTEAAAEAPSPTDQQPDFKTPNRIPGSRSRSTAVFSGESPHNDSDLQHDIIWDAASPSPSRLSKRGRKHPAGAVNISDIVKRIAPKHGRPEVTEPTLQQWIGDSATIPCTPDVQVPKPKKKSPRQNGVDDLLKLAKQFDLNMFHQDEEDVDSMHQQTLDLLSEDISDFENHDQNDFSPSPDRNCQPAVNSAGETDARLNLDLENNLDFLFDEPTQHVKGNLSQMLSQVKPALNLSSKEAWGKPASAGVSSEKTRGRAANDEFEDDWENDDLLNNSLVLEMTQNPQRFTAPKHCSTQKPLQTTDILSHWSVKAPTWEDVGLHQSAVSQVGKENVQQRGTFKLESNPNLSARRILTDSQTNTERSRSSCVGASGLTWKTEQQEPQYEQRTCTSRSVSVLSASSAPQTAQSLLSRPQGGSSGTQRAAASDLLDDDLDALFSSDPVWDDPADDELLCELCEDLENQMHNLDKQTSNQRGTLQLSKLTWNNKIQQPQRQTATAVPRGSHITACENVSKVTQSFSRCVQSAAAAPQLPPWNNNKKQFIFKKPRDVVSTITEKVKCSAAEIQMKKQEAMERRRQRLQAAQNLRAPT